jgi:RibD C-terminal domain
VPGLEPAVADVDLEDVPVDAELVCRVVDVGDRGGDGDTEHDPCPAHLLTFAGPAEQAHTPVGHRREHARQPGGDIYVYGSVSLVRALLAAGLVDELVLMIEPITLGGGKTLFPNDGEARGFELISAKTANTGVQVCRYKPAR